MAKRVILFTWGLVLTLLVSPSFANTPPDVEAQLAAVAKLAQKGDLDGALAQLKAALKAQPNQIPYHMAYIELMIGAGRRAAVEMAYKGFLDQHPKDPAALFLYGKTLADPADRKAQFEAALKADPRSPWARLGLATVALNKTDLDEAARQLREALAVAPTLEPVLEMMGTVLVAQGRYNEAINQYQQLLQLDSATARAALALGRLFTLMERNPDAITALEAGARIEPTNASVFANLGHLYFDAKRYGDARAAYGRALALEPRDELCQVMLSVTDRVEAGTIPHEVIILLREANDLEETDPQGALQRYATAVQMAPDLSMAHLGYGRTLVRLGQVRQGAEELAQAVTLEPNLYSNRMAYAQLMIELNRPADAEIHLKKAASLQPTDAEPWLTLGYLYTSVRQPRGAEAAYRMALPLLAGQEAIGAAVNLAGAVAAQGRVAEAAEAMEAVLAAAPDNVDVRVTLAALYVDLERYDAAEKVLVDAKTFEPRNTALDEQITDVRKMRAAYDENKATKQRASQIVVKDKATAEALLAELKKGSDFAELARTRSIGGEAVDGGDLGFFSQGDLAPELSNALKGVPVGGLTGIVVTSAGYHILKRTN